MATHNTEVQYRGQCQCGTTQYAAATPIQEIARCHCTVCRLHHRRPYTMFVESSVDRMLITGSVYAIISSTRAERIACTICNTIIAMHYYHSPKIWFTVDTITTPITQIPCYDIYTDTSVGVLESLPGKYSSTPTGNSLP